ncbi:hypothetical protein QTP88_010504 [Uroleucon formosanum]
MDNNNVYFKKTKNTILPSLNNFITNAKGLTNSLTVKHNISLSIQFVNGVTQELETDDKAIFKRNIKSDFHNVADYKQFSLSKEQQKYEQIKHEVQAKIGRKNQIEHYFNVVDRQLQFVMKKRIMKSEAIIIAAMKEHEHKVVNLQLDTYSLQSKIESNAKNNEINKKSRMQISNSGWRKGKKQKYFPSKAPKRKGNIAEFNQKKRLKLKFLINSLKVINSDDIMEDLALPLAVENSNDENKADEINLEGRRIVDINYIFKSIKSINHSAFGCTFNNLTFSHEVRNGFISSFYFTCNFCHQKEVIHSEAPCTKFNTNIAMVTAAINIGQGHAQLEELGAITNMPVMSNSKYQLLHNDISTYMNELSWEDMELAGKEKAKITIENNDVDAEGRPMIAVIADGAWSKRSYKTKYNALSGVVCIVGAKTRKILFIGVRNKYCCVCQRAYKNNKEPDEHMCFKNWNFPSTAMEANIIVDGFKRSLDMHNLIYSRLIGDGDSSFMNKLHLAKPYGSDFIIKKIECLNHILRNYVNKLKDIATKRRTN